MEAARLFRVEAVELTTPPVGPESMDVEAPSNATWCRYVISSQSSRVVGRYRGSLTQARRNAEQIAQSFNDRVRNNGSAWSPRATSGRKASRKPRATTR